MTISRRSKMHLPRPKSLLPLFAACLLLAGTSHFASAEWRIGVSLPLATTAEPLADQFLGGARKEIERHNASGGENARLIVVDDGCDAEISELASQDLKMEKADIVTGLICNEAAYTLADTFVDSGTPLLVSGARSIRISKDREKRDWNIWQIAPDDLESPRYAAEVLSRRWAGLPYAIVDDGTVYGRNMADGFRATMEELGYPPQFHDTFRPTQSTQARLVRRLSRAGTTHVFIGASAEDISMIALNAKELEIPLILTGGEELGILPYFEKTEQPPAGLLAILPRNEAMISRPAELDPENPSKEQLIGELGPTPYELLGRQAMEIALKALAENPDNPTVAIAGLRFETVLGDVAFSADGRNKTPYYDLYRWDGERFEKAGDPS